MNDLKADCYSLNSIIKVDPNTKKRTFQPKGIEGSMMIGNATTGFLEIKYNTVQDLHQLTLTSKNGDKIDLFNPNARKGISNAREFHMAYMANKTLNGEKTEEHVHFDGIDPQTGEQKRFWVTPDGYFRSNPKREIDKSEKISYVAMDRICAKTIEVAKAKGNDMYSTNNKPSIASQKSNTHNIDFSNIFNEDGKWNPQISHNQRDLGRKEYIAPQQKTRLCTII